MARKRKKNKTKLLEGKYKVLQEKKTIDKTKGKGVVKTSRMCEDVTSGGHYVKNHYELEGPACGYDYKEVQRVRRGQYRDAGKGDWPRSVGAKFSANYKKIKWSKKEKTKNGVPMPKRTKKVYK
jgi:hypothetical protein